MTSRTRFCAVSIYEFTLVYLCRAHGKSSWLRYCFHSSTTGDRLGQEGRAVDAASTVCGQWTLNLEVTGFDTTDSGDGPFALILANSDSDHGCFDISNAIVGNQISRRATASGVGVRRQTRGSYSEASCTSFAWDHAGWYRISLQVFLRISAACSVCVARQRQVDVFNITCRAYSRGEHCGYLEVRVHPIKERFLCLEHNVILAAYIRFQLFDGLTASASHCKVFCISACNLG